MTLSWHNKCAEWTGQPARRRRFDLPFERHARKLKQPIASHHRRLEALSKLDWAGWPCQPISMGLKRIR